MKAMTVFALLCATQPAQKSTVLFMCPYGGAKSVIAASYFNRAAAAAGLPFVAKAVAAERPYDRVPEPVAEFLTREGFDVASFEPRHVTEDDLASAARIVSIDCDLTKLPTRRDIVRWDDVPKVSAGLPGSVAAIRKHVEALIDELR